MICAAFTAVMPCPTWTMDGYNHRAQQNRLADMYNIPTRWFTGHVRVYPACYRSKQARLLTLS